MELWEGMETQLTVDLTELERAILLLGTVGRHFSETSWDVKLQNCLSFCVFKGCFIMKCHDVIECGCVYWCLLNEDM